VEIHSGAVIGATVSAMCWGEGRYWKFPQAGIVEVGDDAEIGANTTIDRGSLDDTRIAEGVKLDNLVHVGHNCQIRGALRDCGSGRIVRLVRIWKARGGRRAGRFWRALQTGGRCQ